VGAKRTTILTVSIRCFFLKKNENARISANTTYRDTERTSAPQCSPYIQSIYLSVYPLAPPPSPTSSRTHTHAHTCARAHTHAHTQTYACIQIPATSQPHIQFAILKFEFCYLKLQFYHFNITTRDKRPPDPINRLCSLTGK